MDDESHKDQRSNASQANELDARYGKIGISAVAAAVRCQPEQRRPASNTRLVSERD